MLEACPTPGYNDVSRHRASRSLHTSIRARQWAAVSLSVARSEKMRLCGRLRRIFRQSGNWRGFSFGLKVARRSSDVTNPSTKSGKAVSSSHPAMLILAGCQDIERPVVGACRPNLPRRISRARRHSQTSACLSGWPLTELAWPFSGSGSASGLGVIIFSAGTDSSALFPSGAASEGSVVTVSSGTTTL